MPIQIAVLLITIPRLESVPLLRDTGMQSGML